LPTLLHQAIPAALSGRILKEARAQQQELDLEELEEVQVRRSGVGVECDGNPKEGRGQGEVISGYAFFKVLRISKKLLEQGPLSACITPSGHGTTPASCTPCMGCSGPGL
jgi:hypothetical protein